MILLIDNYDSFVYNLARYVEELGKKSLVVRNNEITIDEIISSVKPSHIIISPGPSTPLKAGISIPVVKQLGHKIPILGVCLGHQAIGAAFGATITQAIKPMHGMSSTIYHDNKGLFQGLKNPLIVGRYHSLIVSSEGLPSLLHVNAISHEGEIMAMQHKSLPIFGVQFHPESIMTAEGQQLIGKFFQY